MYNVGRVNELRISKHGIDFIKTPSGAIVFQTRLQTMKIVALTHQDNRRIKFIWALIEMGAINNLDELAGHCKIGIKWTPTKRYE